MGKEDKSLLDIAIDFVASSDGPQSINEIIKYVTEYKSIKKSELEDVKTQFVMDFMLSGNFVYCGDDCWDLKYRQPTSVLDKDGGDYKDFYADDEEVTRNELNDDNEYDYDSESGDAQVEDDDDENEDEDDDSDLSKEFDNIVDDTDLSDEFEDEE